MNWLSNWLYDNAIKCKFNGLVHRISYAGLWDMGQKWTLYNEGKFHKNVSHSTGAYAEGNEMICNDCGEHIYL